MTPARHTDAEACHTRHGGCDTPIWRLISRNHDGDGCDGYPQDPSQPSHTAPFTPSSGGAARCRHTRSGRSVR